MNILAIETSCDDSAVAILSRSRVIANLVSSQLVHAKHGGVIPELASREHLRNLPALIDRALAEAGLLLLDIDYFAVTAGPGLMGALLVGVETARALAFATGKPLIGINHLEGHIFANWVEAKPQFPAIAVLVSGGHSQIIYALRYGSYRIIGETRDDAAGEAFDKVAKLLGLGFPGGPEISKRASTGDDSKFIFPIAMERSNDLDMSFSGLKTAALIQTQKLRSPITGKLLDDFAASFERAVVLSISGKVEDALAKYRVKSLLLSGGVAANLRLRVTLAQIAREHKVKFYVPAPALCTDNAAMIAMAAYYRIKAGQRTPKPFKVLSSLPLR